MGLYYSILMTSNFWNFHTIATCCKSTIVPCRFCEQTLKLSLVMVWIDSVVLKGQSRFLFQMAGQAAKEFKVWLSSLVPAHAVLVTSSAHVSQINVPVGKM